MKHVCVSERRSPFEYRGKLEDAKKAAKDGGMEKDGPKTGGANVSVVGSMPR
jgi:hypothetical protein